MIDHDRKVILDDSPAGRRVKLVRCTDEHTTLRPGDEGTATMWNNVSIGSTLFVKWDNGSSLGLIEGIDQWDWLT
jgi:hypothetical protein